MTTNDETNVGSNRRKSHSLTTAELETLKTDLDTVPEKDRLSCRDVVQQLHPQIRRLQQMGYTINEVQQLLEKHYFSLPLSTLRTYLRQTGYQRKTEKPLAAKQTTTKPKTSAASRGSQSRNSRRISSNATPSSNRSAARFELPQRSNV